MSAEAQKQATRRVVIVAARDEADRIGDTVHTLREAMPGIEVWVAYDASTDGTRDAAMAAGATVVRRNRPHGKGGNMTAAATAALDDLPDAATVLLCDGDLGASAANLVPLLEAVEDGSADLTIAGFERKVGGGLGLAKGYARWAIEHLCGYEANSPISGQRAMSAATLREVLPFAPRYGMEIGMTVDAVRAGARVAEIDLPLEHRATGKTLSGFLHRGRQLRDFRAVTRARRRG